MAVGSNIFGSLLFLDIFGVTHYEIAGVVPVYMLVIPLAVYAAIPVAWFSRGVALKRCWQFDSAELNRTEHDTQHIATHMDVLREMCSSPAKFIVGGVLLAFGLTSTVTGALNNIFWGFTIAKGVGTLTGLFNEHDLDEHPLTWLPGGILAIITQARALTAYELHHNLFPIIIETLKATEHPGELCKLLVKPRFWGTLIIVGAGSYCYYTLAFAGTKGMIDKCSQHLLPLSSTFKDIYATISAGSYAGTAVFSRGKRLYQGQRREGYQPAHTFFRVTGATADCVVYPTGYIATNYLHQHTDDEFNLTTFIMACALTVPAMGMHLRYSIFNVLHKYPEEYTRMENGGEAATP